MSLIGKRISSNICWIVENVLHLLQVGLKKICKAQIGQKKCPKWAQIENK